MLDQSFTISTLKSLLTSSDFEHNSNEQSRRRERLLNAALKAAASNLHGISAFSSYQNKGKTFLKFADDGLDLISRKLIINVQSVAPYSNSSRDQLMETLLALLQEHTRYKVYRLDIKSFYENVSLESLQARIDRISNLSYHSKVLLFELFRQMAPLTQGGLPRGLALSATLADFVLRDFDQHVKNLPDIFFYGRFVDDIVVVTSGAEKTNDLLQKLNFLLPDNLVFHQNEKFSVHSIGQISRNPSAGAQVLSAHSFDYLGYSIEITNSADGDSRKLVIDLSSRTIKKIKHRLVLAARAFSGSTDYLLLRDRIRLLSSNYQVTDFSQLRKRMAGIYFSYPFLRNTSSGLSNLDNFLLSMIFDRRAREFRSLSERLSKEQKYELQGFKFTSGHAKKRFVTFSSRRLNQIKEAWVHV